MSLTIKPNLFRIKETEIKSFNNLDRKKYYQKMKILAYLFRHGPQTNSSLFTATGLSAPTCLALIQELLSDGHLEKHGKGMSIGGRKPDLFGLKDDSCYILSIDMERFGTRIAIHDNNSQSRSEVKSLEIPISTDLSSVQVIYESAMRLIKETGLPFDKMVGVGISMPGLIDTTTGDNYTYLRPSAQLHLEEELTALFEMPVFIQNDVKCATTAECRLGLAKNKKDALVVLMDWGIGLGIIMDGELRTGKKGFTGEIGHIPFVDNGALCYCGKRGCLETVASGIALSTMAKEGIKSGQYSLLNELTDQEIDKIEPHVVVEAANRGDQFAISLLSEVGFSLGKGISILIQLFNPEVIILSGKIAEAKQYITIPIIQAVNTYSMSEIRHETELVLSELGSNASLLGTVSLVMDKVFDQQIRLAE